MGQWPSYKPWSVPLQPKLVGTMRIMFLVLTQITSRLWLPCLGSESKVRRAPKRPVQFPLTGLSQSLRIYPFSPST